MIKAWMAAALYMDVAFAGILAAIKEMGTVKRCPACKECFVSKERIFLDHLITNCCKRDVEFWSREQIDYEVNRIEYLLGMRKPEKGAIYIGAAADRILAATEPLGRCPDPC